MPAMDDRSPPPRKISSDGKFYLAPKLGWQPIPDRPRLGPDFWRTVAGVGLALTLLLAALECIASVTIIR
jgi:hypothetical protein